MKHFRTIVAVFLFAVIGRSGAGTLNIAPDIQHMPNWCWAAASQMIFEYYNVPAANPIDYQCGIVAGVHPICSMNCGMCDVTAKNISYVRDVLSNYPVLASRFTGKSSGAITSSPSYSALSRSDVRMEIDNKRPILVGLSPSGFSFNGEPQHAAVIVGYETVGNNFMLIVNDPFPYDLSSHFSHLTNPYIAAGAKLVTPGQYQIQYDTFQQRLRWTQSLKTTCVGSTCP